MSRKTSEKPPKQSADLPEFHAELPYRQLFEASREPVLLINGDSGCILEANPAASRLLRVKRERLLGRDLLRLFQPASAVKLRSSISLARCEGRANAVRLHALARKTELRGSLVDIEASPGQSTILVHLNAVRERRRPGASAVFAALDTASAGFVVTRGDGRVQYANPAFRRMVGMTTDDLAGASLTQWLQLGTEERAQLQRQMQGRSAVWHLVTLLRDALGHSHPVEVQAVAVPDQRRSYWGYVFCELPGTNPIH
jgi:PAS domain S-box-containing protein